MAKFDIDGGVSAKDILGAIKELRQEVQDTDKNLEPLKNKTSGVIKETQKAADVATSNISKTVQEVEKAVTKSVDITIKELKKLNNIDFSIKIGTGKGQKKHNIADLYPINEDVQSVVSQLNNSKDKIENAISEYHNDIESMRSEMWKYEAKGKSHSKLTQGLFNEKEVDKAYNSFVSANKEKLQGVKDQLVREREELYSAFNNLQNKTNTVKLGDFSNLSLNKSVLKDMVQMVEIAKMIQRYNTQIGVSDSRYEQINVTELQTKVASIAENMINKGISKKFGQEVTQLETDVNKLIEIIQGMQNGEASAFESLKTFAENIVAPFKETKKEIQEVAEELKQASTYIDKAKKTASALSKSDKGYSVNAKFYAMDKAKNEGKSIDVAAGKATAEEYRYVGEVANLLKNSSKYFDSFLDNSDYQRGATEYFKKLIEMKPELYELATSILPKISEHVKNSNYVPSVPNPKNIQNPKVVDADNQAQLETENDELKKKNELLQQQAGAAKEAADAQKELNNAKKNEPKSEGGKLDSTPVTPEIKKESEAVENLTNSYKELSSIKDLQAQKGNGNYSQVLVDGLSEAMTKMKAFYDAGQTQSLEYYAVLSRIANIQKEMWIYNDGGKTTPADQLSQSNKDYETRLSMQDAIYNDFMQFKSTTNDVVDFVIQQFSDMRANVKSSFIGLFDDTGKIFSQKMREELSTMFEPLGDKSSVLSGDGLQTKSLEELVQLYHELGTSNGADEELDKVSNAILDIVQAEKQLDAGELQKFVNILRGLTFVDGDSPILKQPYSVDEALSSLTKLSGNQTEVLSGTTTTAPIKESIRLQDNLGREIDENNAKLLKGTQLIDEQNKGILTLYHNSEKVFDSFDPVNQGGHGSELGQGNYLAGDSKSYNDIDFGRYQTQWYAFVKNIFDIDSKFSAEQIQKLIDTFLKGTELEGTEAFNNIVDTLNDDKGLSGVRAIAKATGKTFGEIFGAVGYDAIAQYFNGNIRQINVFDSSKIVRANDIVDEIPYVKQLSTAIETIADNYEMLDSVEGKVFDDDKKKERWAKAIVDYKNEIDSLLERYPELKNFIDLIKESGLDNPNEIAKKILTESPKDNQTPLSSDSSTIKENEKIIKSNEEVIASEEKVKKYRVANRADIPKIKSNVEPIKDTFQGDVDSSTEATATIVENEKKQQEAIDDTIKKAEEKAEKLKAETQVEIDSITSNEDKSLDQKIKALEGKILTGNKAIAGEKRTADEWKIKIPLMEEALKLLKEEKAEEIRISEEKRQQAKEQAKINALNGEYKSDNYVINQTGKVGDEKGWAYTEQFGVAQTQRVSYKYDDKLGNYVETRAPEYTNFKGLTSAFKQGYETLKKMEYQLQKNKTLYENYDSSALERLIAKQREYVNQLLAEGRIYGQNTDYVMEYRQFVEDAKDIISSTNYKYKDKQNVDKAKEPTAPAYKAASNALVKLDELKLKLQNSNLDSSEYDDLINKTGKITALEKECNDVKTQGKTLTKQEITDIQEKVKLIENEIKGRIEANKIATQLTASSQDDAKRDYNLKIDGFIEKLKEAKFNTESLQKEAQDLKTILASVSDKKGMTDVIAKFKTLGYNFDYEQKKHKTNTNKYNGLYSKIEEYEKTYAELNELYTQEEKNGKSNELTAKIEIQKKKVAELKQEAKDAAIEILNMFKAGSVSEQQKNDAIRSVRNVAIGKTSSDSVLKAIKQDKAIANNVKEQRRIANDLNNIFRGESFGGGIFTGATVSKDNATLTFLEVIGDQAVETKVQIDGISAALVNLQNGGSLNFDDYAKSYKTRNVTAKDFLGINQNDEIQARLDAYNQLYRTEEKYQELQRKVNKQTASKKEISEFNELVELRKYYNKILTDSLKLSKEEKAYYDKIGKAEEDKVKAKYDKHVSNLSRKNDAYGAVDDARIKTPGIQNALASTQQLMNEINTKSQSVNGFSVIFDNAQKDVEELNAALRAGSIDTETYTNKIQNIANGLNNVIKVIEPNNITQAEVAMEQYAKSLPGVEIGKFNAQNNTLTFTYEKQKGVIQEVVLQYDQMSGAISRVDKTAKNTKGTLNSFLTGLKKRFASLGQYLMTFASYYRIIAWIRQGVTVVKELDTALTEMRKVSDESVESLKNFQKVSFDIADSVGTTAKQIQNSTADFMRLGESLEQAAKSAEVANILLNVSEFESIDEATDSLVSMAAAYDELDKIDIVDKLNIIGNNFAISTDGLATALKDSASALRTANNDMDEAVALATAANRVVQDPQKVGAGLRTIALRITGTEAAKAELEELGESVDDFTVTTASKLNEQVMMLTKTTKEAGVSLLDMNGNYRSTYEIISDIADRWEDIKAEDLKTGENRQNALLEMLAGEQFCLKFVETHIYRTHLIARIA